ncbi:KH domain-containing protein [bacterium]|nr:KH domain-containing protein [bacterium]
MRPEVNGGTGRTYLPPTYCMEFDQEFVEYIVKNLVNKPEEVRTERKVDDQGILITVHTAQDDIGYVIGKAGKTAIAIRTLLATLGAKHNMRISFRIDAPDTGKRRGEEMGAAPVVASSGGGDDLAVDSLTF